MLNRAEFCALTVIALTVGSISSKLHAADDTAAFLDAMRNRGMYDLALDFLDSAKDSRLASDEFKSRIAYERGVTLLAKWRKTPNASEREKIAAQIRTELNEFSAANPDDPLVAEARSQLATLLTEMATRSLAVLEQQPGSASDAEATRRQTREQFQEARSLLTEVETSIMERLDEFPKALDPRTQNDQIEQRRELRARLSQIRVLRTLALHQQADTYGQGDSQFTKLNEQAAQEFQELYEKYGSFLVGFYARVYQGECYLQLGKYQEASGCFEDIIAQGGENPAVRTLVTKALALQAECYIAQEQYDMVIAKQGAWLQQAREQEAMGPEWLALKFQVAEAKRLLAAAPETNGTQKRTLRSEAEELYADVAERRGPYQDDARRILSGEFDADTKQAERTRVQTFDEALQAAKNAIKSMNAARQTIPAAEANNPEAVAALREQQQQGFADALHYLDEARRLVDDDTPIAKLNESRWLASWLMWQDEQYYRSAILSGFLARRYPEDPSAAGAAQIALASYDKLYQQAITAENAPADAGRAEAKRLKELASFITRRWGSSSLADTAFGVLLNFSIRESEFDVALELVDQLEASRAAEFKARIGNAMWEAQLRAAARQDASVDRAEMRAKAIELLESSFDQLAGSAAARDTLAAASLYLSQARIDQGNYTEAISLLEDPEVGAIALSQAGGSVASKPAYVTEAYKAALRAYVSIVPPQTDKAVATMAELESTVEASGAADKLTNVYLSLGVQLQQQVENLRAAGKVDEAKRVSEAFVAFLDKLNERGSSDPTVRRWIAQTYYRLADGLEGDSSASDVRKAYYARAGEAFRLLLEEDVAASEDPNRLLALKLQYGQTLRRAGNYGEAMELFESILAEKEMMVDVQTAAAYTLQEWGAAEDTDKFDLAIAGAGPLNDKGKHIVWGWNYLAKVAASVARSRPELGDKYKDLFYECWLNIARIRYLRAEKQTGDSKKQSLRKARTIVKSMVETYPDFLDTPRRRDFDELMKSIQRAAGQRPVGLAELLEDEA